MGTSIWLAINTASCAAARSAALWLSGFYPQVQVTVEADQVELRSEVHDPAGLAAIWSAALANERLLARGRDRRAAAFAALAQ